MGTMGIVEKHALIDTQRFYVERFECGFIDEKLHHVVMQLS
jgi:hypothetical protein